MANKKPSNPVVALISGGIAGGIELTCTWPSEYCKILYLVIQLYTFHFYIII